MCFYREAEMNKRLNYFSTIKFLSKYIIAHRKNYGMFAIGWLFENLLKIFTPIIFAVMIDEIVYYRNVSVYLRTSIAFVIMLLCACIVHFFTQQQYAYLQNMYCFDIKKDMFNKLQYATADFLTDMKIGDVHTTLQYYAFDCMSFVIRNIIHTVNNSLALSIYIIYIFVLGWQFGLLMLIGVPLSVYATTRFGKLMQKCNDSYNEEYGNYNGWLVERLSGISDIRLLDAKNLEDKKFVDFHKRLFGLSNRSSVIVLSAQSAIKMINLVIQMSIYCLCAYFAFKEKMTIGVLTIILTYFTNIKEKVTFFSDYFIEAKKRIACIQKVYDLMNIPTETEWKGRDNIKIEQGAIKFDNISFEYRENQRLFHDFSIDIAGGQKVALIGKSGSGKTTLAYMLIGFYQPKEGSISIDGMSIEQCSLESIRKNIGIVQQDVLIFDGSIRSNLLLGKRNATDEELENACEKAGLKEFIQSLNEGIDTIIGSKGIGISGGQKQRIAIARIYLKDPKIIIFDEATSALDNETEAHIHDEWEKVLGGRTSIVIAHRLNAVKMCEKLALIEDGELIVYGDTKDLLENSNKVKELFAIS